MNTVTRDDALRQKAGGAAALYIALALIAAMPYFLIVVDYLGATTAAEKIALVAANYTSMYGMYLITYVFYGLALGVVALALHDRMRAGAAFAMRFTTALGLLWSFVLVASGLIFTYGMTTVVGLVDTDPTQARMVWQSIEPVAQALGGAGGEILGGLWIFLASVVALRSGALPKLLGWFGVVIGAAGIASIVPPLHGAAIVFGLMLIAWFVWLGVVLTSTRETAGEVDRSKGATRPDAWATSTRNTENSRSALSS